MVLPFPFSPDILLNYRVNKKEKVCKLNNSYIKRAGSKLKTGDQGLYATGFAEVHFQVCTKILSIYRVTIKETVFNSLVN